MLREHQVVMLPTEKARIAYVLGSLQYAPKTDWTQEDDLYPQHLYFVSDEDIKEGDWCIIDLAENSRVVKVKSLSGNHPIFNVDIEDGYAKLSSLKKIVATTNPDLWHLKTPHKDAANPSVPKIPLSFVEVFAKEQGKIEKVNLEYNDGVCKCDTLEKTLNCRYSFGDTCNAPNPNNDFYGLRPKTKSDGSVIVHPFKEKMYTREEVIDILNAFTSSIFVIDSNIDIPKSTKWFNENYPL